MNTNHAGSQGSIATPLGEQVQNHHFQKVIKYRSQTNNQKNHFSHLLKYIQILIRIFRLVLFYIGATVTDLNQDSFTIYQDYCTSDFGIARHQFFISYDSVAAQATSLNAHQISFQALVSGFLNESIFTIQTFIWAVDPNASKETESHI